jgi:DNA-binding MarR family transcriptional regulator
MSPKDLELLTNRVVLTGTLLVREAVRLFKPHGITPAQFNVLHLIELYGEGLRPGEISEKLVVDPASATYLMDQMEQKGWIVRADDPDDRRAYRIMRTPEGKRKFAEVFPYYQRGLTEMAKLLGRAGDPKVAEALVALLPEAAREATELVLEDAPKPKPRRRRKAP